jgi:hypothetical protein
MRGGSVGKERLSKRVCAVLLVVLFLSGTCLVSGRSEGARTADLRNPEDRASTGQSAVSSGAVSNAAGRVSPESWTAYHSYNSTNSMTLDIMSLQSQYPSLCKVVSLGKTWEGRVIWAVKISDNVDVEENEP